METLAITLITIIDQTNVNMYIKLQVKSINPDPLKYQGAPKLHT